MRLRSIRASGGAAAVAGVQRGIEDVDMGLRGPARLAAVGVAVSMVASIGLLRVALGLHFVSDVLAGYVLGAAWVSSKVAVFNLWRRESGRPAVDPVGGLEPENAGRLDPRSGWP
jgi:membrane-associated phospholipid phosphatase